MSDDLEYGKYCAKCGQLMDCPPDLEPTPECNPCAQELLASLRSQLQQRDVQLAERDGRLLAMREALENAMCPHAAGCAHYVSGKPHMHRGVDCDAMHDCNCGLSVALDSISSAAADARRRVEQEALREAADDFCYLDAVEQGMNTLTVRQWLRSRADSLDRLVAESGEGERH